MALNWKGLGLNDILGRNSSLLESEGCGSVTPEPHGCSIPAGVQDQDEQARWIECVPSHGRGVGPGWSLRSLPTQTIQWVCDLWVLVVWKKWKGLEYLSPIFWKFSAILSPKISLLLAFMLEEPFQPYLVAVNLAQSSSQGDGSGLHWLFYFAATMLWS